MKKLINILGILIILSFAIPVAAAPVPGGTLDPTTITKFVTPLFVPPSMPRIAEIALAGGGTADYYEIAVRQFSQQILPSGMPSTTVWGYGSVQDTNSFHSPSLTFEATYNKPVRVKWINDLVDATGNYLPHLLPVDQTLHWANPPGGTAGRDMPGTAQSPYTGPVPIITHLHGAHVTEDSDGYPVAWYLPDANNIPAGYATEGTYYDQFKAEAESAYGQAWGPGSAVFQYPNDQRAATLWYHDHTMGMTRVNVYAGPTGFYIIRGGPDDLASGVLPSGAYEIPLAIQDKSFNADGSLFYPDNRAFFEGLDQAQLQIPFTPDAALSGQSSDVAPIWNPEFFGNTMVVNGNTWPFLQVEPRQYRFRLLNASDSRFMILKLSNNSTFWQIGNDGGFLPAPVELSELLLAPAERADIIINFNGVAVGTNIILENIGPDEPYGGGVPGVDFPMADAATTGQVMQFKVVAPTGTDTSTSAASLTLPSITPLSAATNTRQVSLNEMMSATVWVAGDGVDPVLDGNGNLVEVSADTPGAVPFGPTEAALGTLNPDGTGNPLEFSDPVTENPALNSTEIWEIYNFTADAHPIHIHQVQFEVVNREDIATSTVTGPETGEAGFKDTLIAYPGQITRFRAKFDLAGLYVWHCHILSHEDNEMMRSFYVGSVPATPSDLTAIVMSASRVDLVWTDQSNGEGSFRIERSLNNFATAPSATFTASSNQRTFSDTTISAGNTYSYRIIAISALGESAPSNTATVTVTGKLQAGPIDPASVYQGNANTGVPGYYQDDQGTRVAVFPTAGNGLAAPTQIFDPVVAGNAYSQFLGFGTENFYYYADNVFNMPNGGLVVTVFGIEWAFGGAGNAVPGQEFVFNRTRVRIDVPMAGTYTVQHPYGTLTFNVTQAEFVATGGRRAINYTSDIGVPRDFANAATNGVMTRFLHQTVPPPPSGWIGDGASIGPVTGSPTGFNAVKITGPAGSNLGGPGIDFVQSNNFMVSGRIPTAVTPLPSFTKSLNPVGGAVPNTVTFTDTSTGSPTKWLWDFGDGTTSALQNPVKTYNTSGNYLVRLTVANAVASVATSQTVTIISAPVASFTNSLPNGSPPVTINFTDNTTGNPTSWLWDFGDSSSNSTLQNPSHIYAAAGSYTVSLVATNAAGTSSVSRSLGISANLNAGFSADVASGTAPLTVNFTDTSTGNITSWQWNFGDGTTSSSQNATKTFDTPGNFTVIHAVTDAVGTAGVSGVVNVYGTPAVSFTSNPTFGTVPLTVNFTDTSAGNPASWLWDFGDGTTSTLQNPSKTYSAFGRYTVTLTATNPAGTSSTVQTVSVTTVDPATLLLQVGPINPSSVYQGNLSTGLPSYYQDDQGTRAGLLPLAPGQIFDPPVAGNAYSQFLGYGSEAFYWVATTVSPTSVGQMKTVFGIESAFGGAGNAVPGQEFVFTRTRIVADVPVAGIYTFQHPYGTVTIPVTAADVAAGGIFYTSDMGVQRDFLAAAAVNNGNISRFLRPINTPPAGWIGNGVVGPVTGSPLGTPFNKVRLTGPPGSNLGGPGIDFVETDQFSVNGRLFSTLTPSFTAALSPANGVAPVTVTFTNTTTGNITAWSWNFGDGTTSALQNPPPKTYSTPGTYLVTLTVTDATQATGTTSRVVNVLGAPVASFTKSVAGGVAPLAVNFTDTSTGVPTGWSWDFGDGTTSIQQNPAKTYTAAGTFTVTLTVTNVAGSASTSQNVTITAPVAPVASFTMSATNGAAPLPVSFTDTSASGPTGWTWNFGDSVTSTLRNPSHTFTATGTFTVTLTVTNAAGTSTASQTVTVVTPVAPVASFTMSIADGVAPLVVNFTDTSSSPPSNWTWNFGDGATSTLQNPSHTFAVAGTFTVTLTVTNAAGTSAASQTITVTALVVAVGGGDGTATTPPGIPLTGLTSDTGLVVTAAGIAQSATTLTTADGAVQLTVDQGTRLQTANGQPLNTMTAAPLTTMPPKAPPNTTVVLPTDFGPDGAKFNPPLRVTMKFDPATLPARTSSAKLQIAYWDGNRWVKLGKSTVDAAAGTITGEISHFTLFAILVEEETPVSVPTPELTSTLPTPKPAPVTAPTTTSPAPVPAPPSIATIPSPATTLPVSEPQTDAAPGMNWALVGGVLAGMIVLLLLGINLMRKKPAK